MTVLMTGHKGYIGSVMAPMFRSAGHTVIGLENYLYEGCTLAPAHRKPDALDHARDSHSDKDLAPPYPFNLLPRFRYNMHSSKLDKLVKHQTDNTLIQLLGYAFVGGLAFAVDFVSLYVLTDWLGVYYLRSAALAFLLGLTTNYLLSVFWVFQKRTFQNRLVEYLIFGVLGVLGLALNQGLMYFLTEDVRCHYLFSKVVATGLVFVWNFGNRKLTFPTKVPSDSLGRIGSLKRTSDKSLFPMALCSCGHRITHQLRPINMNGRSILSVTSSISLRSAGQPLRFGSA